MIAPLRRLALALALPWFAVVAISQSVSPPESDDGRQWLDSRTPASSPIAVASRATALNQTEAEKLLRQIVRRAPRSPEAGEAHKLLARIYVRTGRYKEATGNVAEWVRTFPNSADAQDEQKGIALFQGLPDQSNSRRRVSVLKHDGDLGIPVTINGKESTFLWDTGAGVSVISQQGAERLGLEFQGSGGVIGDSSGKGFASRAAVAKELVIGNMRFQKVSFFVVPDEPFAFLPVEQRGILGVPIQFAVGTWQWSKSGTSRLGENLPSRGSRPNLIFFKNKTLVSAEIAGRSVFLTLDSGATNTDLNSNFVESFGSLVANAQKTTREITGAGGTSTFEAYSLAELMLSVGGQPVALRPAEVTLQKLAGIGGECCVGNFGNDLMIQGEGFTLDFDNMSLRIQ